MFGLADQKKLRQSSFSKKLSVNQKLLALIEANEDHAFLTNPSAHHVYLYLVDYLTQFSLQWFEKPLSQTQILDWGCGKGHITFLLQEMGANVVSCDIDQEVGDSSFGQPTPIIENTKIRVLPLQHPYVLPFESQSFDVVLSFGVLEHVPNDLESLKELNRVLSSKGLFFCFFLPYVTSWTQKVAHWRGITYHDRLYNWKRVNLLLKQSHFVLMDSWHRALFPKNSVRYHHYERAESWDQFFCESTMLKHFATNIEFVARKS
jgi:SAM-dependent methyltransferase